jgi:hemerythrin
MMVWDEGYKIGHEEMDGEHLILFSLLNQLNININDDRAGECLGDVLIALGSYIDYHFAHEEALMRSVGYPGLEEHAAKHRDFVAQLKQLSDEVKGAAALQAGLKLRAFVLDWLLSHILETDMDYAGFIKTQAA